MERQRVAIVIHPLRSDAQELAAKVRTWWIERGYDVVDDLATGAVFDRRDELKDVAFAVSLGGDGTMLRTVQLAIEDAIPVLGVNLGQLGYLTEVEPSQIEQVFERLIANDFEIEERMTLEVRVDDQAGETRASFVSLNEAVLEKTAPGHTIRFRADISGRPFLNYVADGILVATPTGSTAYNLSLRGPIVSPHLRAMLVTPIAPHMLFDRSLVLEPDETLRVELLTGRNAALVVDGSSETEVSPGESVTVSASSRSARIVRFKKLDFHAVLREKFNLSDR